MLFNHVTTTGRSTWTFLGSLGCFHRRDHTQRPLDCQAEKSCKGTLEVKVSEVISSTQEITRSGVCGNPKVNLSQEVRALNNSIDYLQEEDDIGHITTKIVAKPGTNQANKVVVLLVSASHQLCKAPHRTGIFNKLPHKRTLQGTKFSRTANASG
ncbi:hypothetical protein J6590_085218 [Homalodisca vitripennis]|nr:hypothetical protein J6590_085218 [Homalodisca vitripennis]